MNVKEFYNLARNHFSFKLTAKQDLTLYKLSEFIFNDDNNSLFVLKGYAGTGKTTILSSIINNLWKIKKSGVLMAPTGRAAKVLANYTNSEANTIHKKIYFPKKNSSGNIDFVLQVNKSKNTIFIIDEASMISSASQNKKLFDTTSLLSDLIQFVYSGHNCKIIFIGDTAQLPPVNSRLSPSLDPEYLKDNYNKNVVTIELDEVVRQEVLSGILNNATILRESLVNKTFDQFKFNLKNFKDIIRLEDGEDIINSLSDSYNTLGKEETALIVRSNKRANLYNQQIRNRILFNENELSCGDNLMVVKNNYHWVKSTSEAGFIANGDIIKILEINRIVDLYDFRFAEVTIQMIDYPKMKAFDTVLMLDTINLETPSLNYEKANHLYNEVMKDYISEKVKYKRFLKVKNNKYFNALQVKFSYAITCHKSQGGQWASVFVEQPYLPNGIDKDFIRWLYTALTRAKEKLYLIGFKDEFFSN
ncbi:MAG: ATP-dependent exoDNAse (exonuclease V) alpha subunit [Flavobacteriaceae bacterium]|jgi:ATP-dependent exoDNAse (exonuclease V) alpha subunit|tara:strand:- start:735 stop:2159 length:1425 start_codon:yes stop_codon:yes gene_type:complete